MTLFWKNNEKLKTCGISKEILCFQVWFKGKSEKMVDIIYEQFLRLSMLSLILLHWVSMFLRVSAFSPTDLLSSLMLIKQTVESSLTWCFNRTDLAHRLDNVHNMSKKNSSDESCKKGWRGWKYGDCILWTVPW